MHTLSATLTAKILSGACGWAVASVGAKNDLSDEARKVAVGGHGRTDGCRLLACNTPRTRYR
eukprot:3456971-Pleurochrysis_carterae.AAC.1